MAGLEVTRRVKVDLKAAAVRYVETFRNPTSAPITARITLKTSLGRSQGQAQHPKPVERQDQFQLHVERGNSNSGDIIPILAIS